VPVAALQDPSTLRLEADVAESGAAPLADGATLAARVGSPPVELTARVEEIAPVADPRSRTRRLKAVLPPHDGLRPGVFATLRLACGRQHALLAPAAAVRRAGQLQTVTVLVDGAPRLRSVRTGKAVGERVEILSGLAAGDVVVIEP
jgi:multidrug efflux pump subunit AcrA (membrane-fusion protein)